VNTIDLNTITFAHGAHTPTSGEMCVMEAAAYIAGEPWSDHPQCVSPVIATFCRYWNDSLREPPRSELLRPLLPLVIGTRTTDADEVTRAWLATDWLVRVQAPAWMDLTPSLRVRAAELRGLAPLTCNKIAVASMSVLSAAESAAYSAARLAAESAAYSAARLAAASAADSAARLAARSTADSAARLAARLAARSTARLAARSTAYSAADLAARLAAESAADLAARSTACLAAEPAAYLALASTVTTLQASAQELVRAMCAVGRVAADGGGV